MWALPNLKECPRRLSCEHEARFAARGSFIVFCALQGKYVWVYRRQPSGAWKQARVIWNSDALLAPPPSP